MWPATGKFWGWRRASSLNHDRGASYEKTDLFSYTEPRRDSPELHGERLLKPLRISVHPLCFSVIRAFTRIRTKKHKTPHRSEGFLLRQALAQPGGRVIISPVSVIDEVKPCPK